MYTKTVQVINNAGLHARPGALFVELASKYESMIKIYRNDNPNKKVNAKSIIFVLALAIKKDDRFTIEAEGIDEVLAVDALTKLVEQGFNE